MSAERHWGKPGRANLVQKVRATRHSRPQSPLFVAFWAAVILYALGYIVARIVGWL